MQTKYTRCLALILCVLYLHPRVETGGSKKASEKGPTEGIEVPPKFGALDLGTAATQAKYYCCHVNYEYFTFIPRSKLAVLKSLVKKVLHKI